QLFTRQNPNDVQEGENFKMCLNPESLETTIAYVEPSLVNASPGSGFQFERLGYFCVDTRDSTPEMPVFNRTVTLRDTWAKIQKAQGQTNKGRKKKKQG
ncbi:MAG: glutamine--tRNA ligase, partial [Deltaproteobacteria bacterium]|nr:glutamine--tRNA ligase [Deltaproteobacteria bacterium]